MSFEYKNQKNDSIEYIKGLINDFNKNGKYEDVEKLEKVMRLIKSKKYGLVWEEHPENVELQMHDNIPVFSEDVDKKINDKFDSNEYNFLLNGDNLHSLTLLEKTKKHSIDIIYIDPPYNTGNKDFQYNDEFVDESDEFRHSKWISFMNKRLLLSKKLLKKDGVIFISIGDEEIASLKLLMDEIFGEDSFKDNLMIEMSATTGNKVGTAKRGGIVKNGEYILVYSPLDLVNTDRQPLYDWVGGFDKHFSLFLNDDGKVIKLIDKIKSDEDVVNEFKRIKSKKESISLKTFAKYFNRSKVFTNFAKENVNNIVRLRSEVPNIPENVKKQLVEDKWLKYNSDKREEPYYLTLNDGEPANLATMKATYNLSDDYNPIFGRSRIRGDYWKGFWKDMGNIGKEGGVKLANGKKPVRLIEQLLKWAHRPSGIVLDFFAGSGTTGHAVNNLNNNYNYDMKFILATNEEVIDTAYHRMMNISKENPLNLKFFDTGFVNKNEFKGYRLENKLSEFVRPLIELEYGIDIKDSNVKIAHNEQEMQYLIENESLKRNDVLFLFNDIFLDSTQNKIISDLNIDIREIPDCYYSGEMWS